MSEPWNLTPRERQVMEAMIKHGGVQKVIARELGIASKTVSTLYGRACEKIDARNHTLALLEWDRWMRAAQAKAGETP